MLPGIFPKTLHKALLPTVFCPEPFAQSHRDHDTATLVATTCDMVRPTLKTKNISEFNVFGAALRILTYMAVLHSMFCFSALTIFFLDFNAILPLRNSVTMVTMNRIRRSACHCQSSLYSSFCAYRSCSKTTAAQSKKQEVLVLNIPKGMVLFIFLKMMTYDRTNWARRNSDQLGEARQRVTVTTYQRC